MVARTLPCILALLLVLLPAAATAQTWTESPDAGDTIPFAQVTVGNGPLTTINGTFWADTDSDLYCIRITDPQTFKAWLNCSVLADPDICLFDATGLGVALDDGCAGGQTYVNGANVSGPGTYYLGVLISDAEPLSLGGSIWNPPMVSGPRAPDGPGAGGPLYLIQSASSPATYLNYTVSLTGCTFCDSPVPAETGSWGRVKGLYR